MPSNKTGEKEEKLKDINTNETVEGRHMPPKLQYKTQKQIKVFSTAGEYCLLPTREGGGGGVVLPYTG